MKLDLEQIQPICLGAVRIAEWSLYEIIIEEG